MRAVVQRVHSAEVRSEGRPVGSIGAGLLVYLGVAHKDTETDCRYVADKILGLRVFPDSVGTMNTSICEQHRPAILVVSQFTLYGDARKGRRPSYNRAAAPAQAEHLYGLLCTYLRDRELQVETGRFQALMEVESVGDGPVTILIDSHKEF